MRKLYFNFVSILFFGFLLNSCDNTDDSNILFDEPKGLGFLSFEIFPVENTFNIQSNNLTRFSDCETTPIKYVRIALKDSQGKCYYGNDDTGFHEIELDPLGLDTNNDNILDTWRTSENMKLLLPVGTYTLEYLAVTNKKGLDSEIVLMCPRYSEEDNIMLYHRLVTTSLPYEFSIKEGEENFLHLESLCFKKEHAYEFGLVFISLDDLNPFYLCGL